jgi:hypothetical protein
MDRSIVDRIRARAYEIWISTGCPEGQAEYHWLAAENEILQSGTAPGPNKEFAPGQKVRARREPRKAIKKTV